MVAFIAALAFTAAFAGLARLVATRRGRSHTAWTWLGALLGPFALIALAALPPVRRA